MCLRGNFIQSGVDFNHVVMDNYCTFSYYKKIQQVIDFHAKQIIKGTEDMIKVWLNKMCKKSLRRIVRNSTNIILIEYMSDKILERIEITHGITTFSQYTLFQ